MYSAFVSRQPRPVPKDTPTRKIEKVAIIGGGTMGGGIAMNFVNVGIPVTLKEVNSEALDRGLAIIRGNYDVVVKKGRMSEEQLEKNMTMISGSLEIVSIFSACRRPASPFVPARVSQSIAELRDFA